MAVRPKARGASGSYPPTGAGAPLGPQRAGIVLCDRHPIDGGGRRDGLRVSRGYAPVAVRRRVRTRHRAYRPLRRDRRRPTVPDDPGRRNHRQRCRPTPDLSSSRIVHYGPATLGTLGPCCHPSVLAAPAVLENVSDCYKRSAQFHVSYYTAPPSRRLSPRRSSTRSRLPLAL